METSDALNRPLPGIILLLCFLCLLSATSFGQSYFLNAKSTQSGAYPETQSYDNTAASASPLNTIFNTYQVTAYYEVYPGAQSSSIQGIYHIDCDGNIDDLKVALENSGYYTSVEKLETAEKLTCTNPASPYNDPYTWASDWHLTNIEALCAWGITDGNEDLPICIADDNFYTSHEDLSNKFTHIYGDGDDPEWHGTHVAGVAAAECYNSLGIAGLGYKTKFAGFRVQGGDPRSAAWDAAHTEAESYNGHHIVNVSWTLAADYDAAVEMTQNGTLLVISAGNYYSGQCAYDNAAIAGIPGVIMVSATNINDEHGPTQFSHCPEVDLCAPGWGIYTTAGGADDAYINVFGTSFSAPLVAATAALVWEVNPCLDPWDVEEIIKATTDPIADASSFSGTVGTGRLNTYQAVLKAKGEFDPITSYTLWADQTFVQGDLVIEPGGHLEVTGEVVFSQDGRIVVRPGGKLTVDGGTLTSRCEYWTGVHVEGNSAAVQNSTNQGVVRIINGGMIEYAQDGIYLIGITNSQLDYNKTGGLVLAKDAIFKDNRRDVAFWPYRATNGSSTREVPNRSCFFDCQFITTDDYRYQGMNPHITIWRANGVQVKGCLFEDQRGNIDIRTEGRDGIFSNRGSFRVDDYCTGASQPPCGNPTRFLNMKYGVHSAGLSNPAMSISVQHAQFNCHKGIYLRNVDHAVLNKNDLDVISDPSVNQTDQYPYGIYLEESTGFSVQENEFYSDAGSGGGKSAGLVIRNSGPANNEFYKNTFHDLNIASEAIQLNRDPHNNFPPTGLRFSCNDYQDNEFDLFVTDDLNDPTSNENRVGMAFLQGKGHPTDPNYALPAMNAFGNSSPILDHNIDNQGWFFLYPVNAAPASDEVPSIHAGIKVYSNLAQSYGCPSKLGAYYLDKPFQYQELVQKGPMMVDKRDEWVESVDGNNTAGVIASIQNATSGNVQSVYNNLVSLSPWLSESSLVTLAGAETPFTTTQITNVMVLNPHAARSPLVNEALDDRTNQLSISERNSIDAVADQYTTKDGLEFSWTYYSYHHDQALNILARRFACDTLDTINPGDSLAMLFTTYPHGLPEEYIRYETYRSMGETSLASTVLSNIPSQYDLTTEQEEVYNDYVNFMQTLSTWEGSGMDLSDLGTEYIEYLEGVAENNSRVGAMAWNLLELNGNHTYTEHVFLPDQQVAKKDQKSQTPADDIRFQMYPNPTSGMLTIESKDTDIEVFHVLIFDLSGRQVLKERLTGNIATLRLHDNMGTGLYLVEIRADNEVVHRQQIVLQ